MNKVYRLLTGILLILSLSLSSFVFADPSGVFDIVRISQRGERQSILTLNSDGTGSLDSDRGINEFSGATIEGSNFGFEIDLGEMTVTYSGTVEGDSVSGSVTSEMGESTFTGQRK